MEFKEYEEKKEEEKFKKKIKVKEDKIEKQSNIIKFINR